MRKQEVARRCGHIILDCVKHDRKPRDIATRKAFENAIAGVAGTGGSTNAVLHLIAMAREAGVELVIEDFNPINNRTPLFVDLKPGGKYVAVDVDLAGGIGVIAQRLMDGKFVDGSALTCTGRTFAEEAADAKETPGQKVIRPLSDPLKLTGGLQILRGSLAPEGCVVKLAGHDKLMHRGPARVFEREEDAMLAVTEGRIQAGDVVVIRYEGPRGGPGMREMLGVTSAANGGPIAAVHEGDSILVDVAGGVVNIEVDAAELAARLKEWKPPAVRYPTGVFAKYVALVSSASEGAVTGRA